VQLKEQRQTMKVVDNVLSESDFKIIKDYFTGSMIVPYYLTDTLESPPKESYLDCFQFVHMSIAESNTLYQESLNILTPLLRVLNPYTVIRLKVNITHKTSKVIENGLHTDEAEDRVPKDTKVKSSIFYLNSNDGYTSFETGERIESVENRLLLFDAMKKHAGSTCTNAQYRAVVNCVYI
jgi:hypothetical protein